MRVIIVGAGKVGYGLAEKLSSEDHDITIVDINSDVVKKVGDQIDVICIKGNCLSTKVMIDAGVKEVDLLIATTTRDEINMICCLTGKKLGARYTIARIRDPEYSVELSQLKSELGLDMIINPEQITALEIAELIKFPAAINVENFSKGHVEMLELKLNDEPIINMTLESISSNFYSYILIGAVLRNNDLFIPSGDFILKSNDIIYIIGRPARIFEFCKKLGIRLQKIKNVVMVGGGRVAYYLAKYLIETEIKVKIIESNRARCLELAELLPKALVIFGDGLDENILNTETLNSTDALVSVTNRDEENIISALLAKQYNVSKVLAKINRINYYNTIKDMGIDNIILPRFIIINFILKYIRGLQVKRSDSINALYEIIDGRAEVIELSVDDDLNFLNTPLYKLKFRKNILLAGIVRGNDIIIPHGSDIIKKGDDVIIIAKDKKIMELNDIIGD
jgi:trk system potassium uptake protein TrkA